MINSYRNASGKFTLTNPYPVVTFSFGSTVNVRSNEAAVGSDTSNNEFIASYSWSQSEIINLGLHCQFEDKSDSMFQNLKIEASITDTGKLYRHDDNDTLENDWFADEEIIFTGEHNIASLVYSENNPIDAWQPLSVSGLNTNVATLTHFTGKIGFFRKCPLDCSFDIEVRFPSQNFIISRYWNLIFFEISFFGYNQLSFIPLSYLLTIISFLKNN